MPRTVTVELDKNHSKMFDVLLSVSPGFSEQELMICALEGLALMSSNRGLAMHGALAAYEINAEVLKEMAENN